MMRNLLFDLDGTIIHSFPGIERALLATFNALGRPAIPSSEMMSVVGLPLDQVFGVLFGEGDPDVERAVPIYRKTYMEIGLPMARPFEGIHAVIEALSRDGRTMFVVTARNQAVARGIVKTHGMEGAFAEVRGEVPEAGFVSKGFMVADVLARHGLDPEETIMIGDRRFDAEAASQNGCAFIGVTWGYGSVEELRAAGAQRFAATPQELLDMLTQFCI